MKTATRMIVVLVLLAVLAYVTITLGHVYGEEIALGIKVKPRRKRAVRDAGRPDCAIEEGSSFAPKPVRFTSVAFLSALLWPGDDRAQGRPMKSR